MEKQLGWACKLGGVEPLWISKVGHTVLTRVMESQIMAPAYQLCEGGLSKRTMASACPHTAHFSLSLCTTGALQAATLKLKLRGSVLSLSR